MADTRTGTGTVVDIESLRAQLFSIPVPPSPGRGRPYATTTTLGRIMRLRGLTVNEVAKVENGPSARQLSEYLAGKPMTGEHVQALAAGLGVDARLLRG